MKRINILFISLFILVACKNNEEREKLYDEVMTIHDEVMPRMDEIVELKSSLNKEIEQISQYDSVDESTIEKMQSTKKQLEEADEAMMEWMRNFKTDFDDMAKKEVLNYLQKQKSRIKKVGLEMDQAIEQAKSVLNERKDDKDH